MLNRIIYEKKKTLEATRLDMRIICESGDVLSFKNNHMLPSTWSECVLVSCEAASTVVHVREKLTKGKL